MSEDVLCPKCGTQLIVGCFPFCRGNPEDHGYVYGKTSIFPYTVNHVDGKPMVIQDLAHLRRVERDFGVVFSAFSHASSDNIDPVSRELPRFRGNDEDIRHNYRDRYRK